VKSRIITAVVVAGGLAVTQAALRPLARPVEAALRAAQPERRAASLTAMAGQGLMLGVLGGFRAITADLTWVRVFAIWEQHDLPATETMLRLVTAIDPRPVYFWLNGARIVANDMTAWRVAAAGGYDAVPVAEQQRLAAQQGRLALRRLDEARAFHPGNVDLWIERASIELNRLHQPLAAAESYRRAWALPGAPYFVARLHAEMLRRAGHPAEALAWLVRLHPQLPAGDETAGADLVLARIRDLERELGVPAARAYHPATR
jgi:hypothetical protein